jgi:DNA repair exonuclease SbcCD nuclease subunit
VATILHLTDLHLEAPSDYAGGNFKQKLVPAAQRPSRTQLIRDTVEALANSDRCPKLDCVIFTGDIPWQNSEKGWERFESVLEPLRTADKLPKNDHIIVTPGNHDVEWKLPVNDAEHYERFRRYARDPGYITPLLDEQGDFNEDGALTTDPSAHYLADSDLGLLVVPLNSSHYCGTYEPLKTLKDDELEKALTSIDKDTATRLRDELTAHRLHDVPRVSGPQMRAVRYLLEQAHQEIADAGLSEQDLVSVAAVHHHTLPVSEAEEFKTFESMPNLGAFRQFLVDARFDVLAHGHKHAAGAYWDRVHRSGAPLVERDRSMLVISGSTLASYQQGQEEVARLIEVHPNRRERFLDISKVPAVLGGGQLPNPLSTDRARLWKAEMAPPRECDLVTGSSVNDVYQRLQALFASRPEGSQIHHLVCEVEDAEDAERLPDGYPEDVPGDTTEERTSWLRAMVEWWQRDQTRLLDFLHFTHGQRIRRHGAAKIDQLDQAIQALRKDPDTTRAVISLIDPQVDALPTDRGVPSFSLAHLSIRRSPSNVAYIDCVGIFRKQDMRYWWPINVAELRHLQRIALKRLARPDLQPGIIVTYAALAHLRDDVPEVNVTAVDRLADDDETRLWSMAHLLAHPEDIDAAQARNDWQQVLDDLEPHDEYEPRPVLGLNLLSDRLNWLGSNNPDSVPARASHQLDVLEGAYEALTNEVGDPAHWRSQIKEALSELRTLIEETKPSAAGDTMEGTSL